MLAFPRARMADLRRCFRHERESVGHFEGSQIFVGNLDDIPARLILRIFKDLVDGVGGSDGGFSFLKLIKYDIEVMSTNPARYDAVDLINVFNPALRRLEARVIGGFGAAA